MVLSALWAGCGADAPGSGDATERADVSVYCEIDVRRVVQLGALDDPVSIADPYGPPTVAGLPDGGWVVLDGVVRRILRYGPDGGFRGLVGAAGEGPEELVYPDAVARGAGDSLWVADRRQPRWVVFDPDGRPVRTVRLDEPRLFGGRTPSGLFWSLHRVSIHGPSPDGILYGDVERMGLVLRRYHVDGRPLEPLGPGLPELGDGGRVSVGWGAVHALSDTVFLYASSWNGEDATREASLPIPAPPGEAIPGVWRWTPGSNRVWTPPGPLLTELERLGLPPAAMVTAIGPDGAGGFWLLGAARTDGPAPSGGARSRPARAEGARLDTTAGGLGVRNEITDGVAWHLDAEGRVTGATRFDELPDGLVGPDAFHTLWEDPTNGWMAVRIHRLERRCG